jgi:hypothetical protein
MLVLNLAGVAVHHHHTGIFSSFRRGLGNEVEGQIKSKL